MTAKTKRISTLIDSQLPEFISNDYEMFGKFVKKYYESLEVQGGTLDISSNLRKYLDINFYDKEILNQYDSLALSLTSTDDTIVLHDARSFPEKNGYVKIDDEIILYEYRTNTELKNCSRGVSGNTILGDLYTESDYKTTNAAIHSLETKVYNVSNLFLYAFVKNFEYQYLNSFPEKYLKGDVDKRTLIKNIQQFYKSKGTESSIKFIFNSIIPEKTKPSTYNPRDFTYKSSTSDWVKTYTLKVKLVSGDINNVIGKRITQVDKNGSYASAVVDTVKFAGKQDGEIYELVLSPDTVNGTFKIASRTKLTKDLLNTASTGNRVTVESTFGWKKEGEFVIGNETFTFLEKNLSQFYIDTRSSQVSYDAGTYVYDYHPTRYNNIEFVVFGSLYELIPDITAPYSRKGDLIQVKDSGFKTKDRILFDRFTQNYRWNLNTQYSNPLISSHTNLQNQVSDFISGVSSIYQDQQNYYICSSGYPGYDILGGVVIPNETTLVDQNGLKIIRKTPITTPEIYPTNNSEVGIFVDGSLVFGYKDTEFVEYGNIEKITVTTKGNGYARPPYVLVNNRTDKASAVLFGDKVGEIIISDSNQYTSNPEITITSGRGAVVTPIITGGEITDIVINNQGEYYSSPPIVRIFDNNGKGRFASYESVISSDGKLVGFVQINKGKSYDIKTVNVEIIPQGSGATAKANIRKWVKNRYNNSSLDEANGALFDDFNKTGSKRYGIVANPVKLRYSVGDNITGTYEEEDISNLEHSKILGYAFDGNPIYGPYGFESPGSTKVAKMYSGYVLKTSRPNGPLVSQYPLGTFVDDYEYVPNQYLDYTYLDKNNGRYCITPDYPEGTYAYFITLDQFPYVIGENYYSIPVISNYESNLTQNELPKNASRLNNNGLENNGINNHAIVQSVKKGTISSARVVDSTDVFSVDSELNLDSTLLFNNDNTGGGIDAAASVSEIYGRKIKRIDATQTKPIKITTDKVIYFYDGDIVKQNNTGASGTVVGDSFNIRELVLKETNGTFNDTDLINAYDPSYEVSNQNPEDDRPQKKVLNLILDIPSSFTKGSIIRLVDSDLSISPFAIGTVLESTINQNNLKILQNIDSDDFIINDSYTLRSNNISDTSSSKIADIINLSSEIPVYSINSSIALVETEDEHRLSIGDIIDVDIKQEPYLAETTYFIKKRKFQKIKLSKQIYSSSLVDSGIGRFDTLVAGYGYADSTYGGATFNDVELVFPDVDRSRNSLGQVVGNSDDAVIGTTGASNNARATVVVGYTYTASGFDTNTDRITLPDTDNVFPGMEIRGNNIASDSRILEVNRNANIIRLNTGAVLDTISTVVINPGIITSVTITNKGKSYRRGDTFSFGSSLDKSDSSDGRDYLGIVDHVGLSKSNVDMKLSSVQELSIDDLLLIGSEIVKVTAIDSNSNVATIERAQNNTEALDHYNDSAIRLHNPQYRFTIGQRLGDQESNDPIVYAYDNETNILTLAYDYTVTNPRYLSRSNRIADNSLPVGKTVSINEDIAKYDKFEYSTEPTGNFQILTNLDLQKGYSYVFDTSHSSMAEVFFTISPSFNRNLVAVDSFRSPNGSSVKFIPGSKFTDLAWFNLSDYLEANSLDLFDWTQLSTEEQQRIVANYKPIFSSNNIITNNSIIDEADVINYTSYYVYDLNDNVDVSDTRLNIIEDPLAGLKKVIFVSDTRFAYEYENTPQYDVTIEATLSENSDIKYSTTNKSAIGKIKNIRIDNVGKDYESLPTLYGVVPSRELQCIIDVKYDSKKKTISNIELIRSGSNYVKPKAVILGDGFGAEVDLLLENGKITSATLKKGGNYSSLPQIKVVESALTVYFESTDIGTPESIKVINSGYLHNTDTTINREYCSYTTLVLDNVVPNSFVDGETVICEKDGVVYATAVISENGYKKETNILRVKNVFGEFIQGLTVRSKTRSASPTITKILVSKFSPRIESFNDNLGYYTSSKGKLGERYNKLTDSNFYQDFSYVVKSKTSIDAWKDLILETTHPAGFKVFGEYLIESKQKNTIDKKGIPATNYAIVNLAPKLVGQKSDDAFSKIITTTFINIKNTNEEVGTGYVSVDDQNNSETYATEIEISPNFDGITRSFTIKDKNTNAPLTPYNEQQLIITLDGVFQEPGVSYTVSGSNIIFDKAPIGESIFENQTVPGQSFYGRSFKFKSNSLNQQYLRKVRNFFQRNGRWIDAANQIKFNRNFIAEEALGYVQSKYPNIRWNVVSDKCLRDIGLFVDAIEHDIRFGGNFKTISGAEYYFENGGDTVKHISDEVTESLDAFKYAAKLCAAAMRNWDHIVTNATMNADEIQVDSTFGIVVGMNVSSGNQYPVGTKVTEIIDDTTVRVSNNVADASTTALVVTQDTIITESGSAAGVQVNEDPNDPDDVTLQIGVPNAGVVTLSSVTSVYQIPQVTFSLSKINNGTLYDASNQIENNRQYIQEETLGWVKNQYPSLVIPDDSKCQRDTGYFIDAVVYSLRYGGTKKIVDFAKSYYEGNKLKHISNELQESIAAYNHAIDLMVLAMQNLLPSGTYTSISPVNDLSILDDPNEVFNEVRCFEVESALRSYSSIVKVLLGKGIGIIPATPENDQRSGNWTNLKTYSNYNIIPDAKLVSFSEFNASEGSKECSDVENALQSLYGGIESTLLQNPVTKNYADYVDNETKEFDLYYEDSTVVKTDSSENLLVFVNGIIQLPGSYSIIRSDDETTPDKILFDENLKWQQNLNTLTVQEPLAVDTCFILRVGSYETLTIDNRRIPIKKTGPFAIFDSKTNTLRKIDDSRYAYVFVDGVLQQPKSYRLTGSTISFLKPLDYQILDDNQLVSPRIDIIVFYGRDIDKKLSFYDFEASEYFNKIYLNISRVNSPGFDSILNSINQSFRNNTGAYNISDRKNSRVLYQVITDGNGVESFANLGRIKKIFITANNIQFVLSGGNLPVLDPSADHLISVDGTTTNSFNTRYSLNSDVTISKEYDIDEDSQLKILPRDASPLAYDTNLSEIEWNQKLKMISKLKIGDKIKVDGERDTREILDIPRVAFTKENRDGFPVDTSIYSKVSTTNYNGFSQGVGLGVRAELDSNGSITNLIWNKRDYSLIDSGIIDITTARNYFTAPKLQFIPIDNNGGGASANVLVINGEIVDIILTNPGSGYTQPPNIVISRGYTIDKFYRKIDYRVEYSYKIFDYSASMSSSVYSEIILRRVGAGEDDFIITVSLSRISDDVGREIVAINFSQSEDNLKVSTFTSSDSIRLFNMSDTVKMSTQSSIETTNIIKVNQDVKMSSNSTLLTTNTIKTGSVDSLYNNFPEYYHQNILGNRVATLESFKYMSTGFVNVSGLSIGDYALYLSELDLNAFSEGDGNTIRMSANSNRAYNLGYPSIQNYASILDVSANDSDTTIYASTTSFPSSGTILLGSEIISYTSKLDDRFMGVTRGENGTTSTSHDSGEYIRTM